MPTTTGCLTNACEDLILDHLVGNTQMTASGYLALLVATPTETSGTEVTTAGTNGYARIQATTSNFASAAASRSISNTAAITFGPSTGGPWSTVAYWGLYTASTGGTLLAYGDITDGTVGTDDSYRINIAGLTLTWTSTATTKWVDAVCHSVLDRLFRGTAWTFQDNYVALFSGDPHGAGTEITTAGTNGYARQAMAAAYPAASGGSVTNASAALTFGPNTTSNWGTVDYFAVYTASTAGTKLGGAALTASKTVNIGDSFEFATSQLTFTMD